MLEAIDIGNVGGLENLKEFLQIRKAGWDKDLPVKVSFWPVYRWW